MTLLWLPDVLRAAGLTVIEHPGWQTHDRPGEWSPRYGVVHATAAPRIQADSVQVRVVRDGRTGLKGPIANAAVDRLGRWHVLSAGRCNSTLTGTAGPYRGLGNTYALSVEGCNDNVSEPWPAVQYEAYVRGWAAWCRRLGWTASHLVGHKEHTPGHKTDPTFNMGRFRADVAAVLAGEGNDMFEPQDRKMIVDVHHALFTNDAPGRPAGSVTGKVDEIRLLAEVTLAAVKGVDTKAIIGTVNARADALAAQVATVDEAVLEKLRTAGAAGLDALLRGGLTEAERLELSRLLAL